jgi:hypothetical protein
MAKPKTHYWKKSNPRNPVPLTGGGFFEVEIVSQSEGIAQVTDPAVQEELERRLGTYGLEQIDKAYYEDLKKNKSSTSLKAQVREEIGGISSSHNPEMQPGVLEVGATVTSDGVNSDTGKSLPLPEDYTPKASKRPKPK